jgi:hypothetical protein
MQKKGWILVFVCAVLVFASVAYGQEPSVTITNAYTTNYKGELSTEFQLWEPVFLHIEYTITGDRHQIYRSVGTIRGLGTIIIMKDRVRVRERDLMFDETRVINNNFETGTMRTIKYKVRLFLGPNLLDSDTAESTISIVP